MVSVGRIKLLLTAIGMMSDCFNYVGKLLILLRIVYKSMSYNHFTVKAK